MGIKSSYNLFSSALMSNARSLTGGPPRDAEFSNLSVANTLVVRGKSFAQDLESIDLTVLDLTTLADVVITGNQEVDGTSLFSGAVTFNAPVTFNSTVTLPNGASLAVTQVDLVLAPLPATISGTALLTKQANIVDVTADLVNNSGGAIPAGTLLFTLPVGSLPVGAQVAVGGNPAATFQLGTVTVDNVTGDVTYQGPAGNWTAGATFTLHLSYISP